MALVSGNLEEVAKFSFSSGEKVVIDFFILLYALNRILYSIYLFLVVLWSLLNAMDENGNKRTDKWKCTLWVEYGWVMFIGLQGYFLKKLWQNRQLVHHIHKKQE
jgi:hypothetical protein